MSNSEDIAWRARAERRDIQLRRREWKVFKFFEAKLHRNAGRGSGLVPTKGVAILADHANYY